ncbi:MAG: AAA family ATPase [Verrucomicrobia bacterium]|nr:AAA family ATPase [Verrucomicrobiota bacterium]MBU1735110.1 AAA family ATPase [Verrucomicrobiota bacterium]MBU1856374.1 AAA family ATPase [Verrucomicrobiota bacterium]
MAKILITGGAKNGEIIDLQNADLVLGRHSDCDLILDDTQASSHHARIYRDKTEWMLTDLKSTNGTLVNQQPVSTATLQDNDLIEIGDTQIRFQADGHAEQAPQAQAGVTPAPAVQAPAAKAPITTTADDLALVEQMSKHMDAIRTETAKVIVGQREVLDQILMCMIAGGHALLVGMPGMAKTLMVSTIAKVLDMDFKRIQFTPDLMPTDITGTEVLETNRTTNEKDFRFMRGPIFCNLLLADEINRTPPKTQAALLEAMQEKRVTVGNTTYTLDAPFFVLATQNPIEQEGTYPLPEAQMDRFMFNIWVDYPLEHEEEVIIRTTTVTQTAQPQKVLSKQQVIQLQQVVRKIPVSEHVIKYAIRLVRTTRPGNEQAPDFIKEYVHIGAGPRAGQFLILAAKAQAVMGGRIHVSCNDIKIAAIPVLKHRIYTNFAADSEGLTSMDLIKKLLAAIAEPAEADYT